jgi:hypothetical protein
MHSSMLPLQRAAVLKCGPDIPFTTPKHHMMAVFFLVQSPASNNKNTAENFDNSENYQGD